MRAPMEQQACLLRIAHGIRQASTIHQRRVVGTLSLHGPTGKDRHGQSVRGVPVTAFRDVGRRHIGAHIIYVPILYVMMHMCACFSGISKFFECALRDSRCKRMCVCVCVFSIPVQGRCPYKALACLDILWHHFLCASREVK